MLLATLWGPTSVQEALDRVDAIGAGSEANQRLDVTLLRTRAQLEAMLGRFDTARDLIARAARTDLLDDRAQALADLAVVLRLDGRAEESANAVKEAIRLHEEKGNVVARDMLRGVLGLPPKNG